MLRSQAVLVRIDYISPYRFDELLAFFRERALTGVEVVDESSYARTVRIEQPDGSIAKGWIRVRDEPARHRLALEISDSLALVIPEVIGRVRRMFDTDSDPDAIARDIAPLLEARPGVKTNGVRVPGCFDPFETACRAVIGQQITVQAANKIAARVAHALGAPVDTGIDGLDRAWPTPDDIVRIDSIEDALGTQGVIKTRSRVIREIARMLVDGELELDESANAMEQMDKLLAIKGVGPWTANYIAMRTLAHPDAFMETDAGVAHALPDLDPKERVNAVEPCRPWRSYAVIALWNSLAEEMQAQREQER